MLQKWQLRNRMEPLKLINAPFPLEFAGERFEVQKANLEKVILFQARFNKLTDEKDPAIEARMAGYCIYLALRDVKPGVTEEWVNSNVPGTIEFADVVEQLGFMSGQKVEILRKVLKRNSPETNQQAGPTSSQ